MKQGIYISPTGQIALVEDGVYSWSWGKMFVGDRIIALKASELEILLDGWERVGEL